MFHRAGLELMEENHNEVDFSWTEEETSYSSRVGETCFGKCSPHLHWRYSEVPSALPSYIRQGMGLDCHHGLFPFWFYPFMLPLSPEFCSWWFCFLKVRFLKNFYCSFLLGGDLGKAWGGVSGWKAVYKCFCFPPSDLLTSFLLLLLVVSLRRAAALLLMFVSCLQSFFQMWIAVQESHD